MERRDSFNALSLHVHWVWIGFTRIDVNASRIEGIIEVVIMSKTLVVGLPLESRWVIFARWIIASGLFLWATLYIFSYWAESDDMMLFNCINLMAFLGFGIALLLILIDPDQTYVMVDDEN